MYSQWGEVDEERDVKESGTVQLSSKNVSTRQK